jgi:hypothetical protein
MATARFVLTSQIYTRNALDETADAFAKLCEIAITSEDDSHTLELSCAQPQIADEFLNYALALSAQELLG